MQPWYGVHVLAQPIETSSSYPLVPIHSRNDSSESSY
jgi:hypothetical protein